jgi:hypothetical protein
MTLNFNFKRLKYGRWLYWIFFWVSPAAAFFLKISIQLPGHANVSDTPYDRRKTRPEDSPTFHVKY